MSYYSLHHMLVIASDCSDHRTSRWRSYLMRMGRTFFAKHRSQQISTWSDSHWLCLLYLEAGQITMKYKLTASSFFRCREMASYHVVYLAFVISFVCWVKSIVILLDSGCITAYSLLWYRNYVRPTRSYFLPLFWAFDNLHWQYTLLRSLETTRRRVYIPVTVADSSIPPRNPFEFVIFFSWNLSFILYYTLQFNQTVGLSLKHSCPVWIVTQY